MSDEREGWKKKYVLMWVVTGNSTTTALSDGIFTTAVTSSSLRSAGASGGTATAWSISLGEKKRVGGGAFCCGEVGCPLCIKCLQFCKLTQLARKLKMDIKAVGEIFCHLCVQNYYSRRKRTQKLQLEQRVLSSILELD